MYVSWKRAAFGVALMAIAACLVVLALSLRAPGPTIEKAVAELPAAPPAAGAQSPLTPAPPEATGPPVERSVAVKGFGRVTVYAPSPLPGRVVILITRQGAAAPADADRARALGARNVVAVLTFDGLERAQGTVRCWFPAGVLEEIAKDIERQLNLPAYHSPVLVGLGAGAALAYASLAEAPAGTFAGGAGVDYAASLPTNRPLCGSGDWKPSFDAAAHSAHVPSASHPAFEWRDLGRASASGDAAIDAAVDTLIADAERAPEKAAPPSASAAELERRLAALKLSLEDTWAEHPKASLIFLSGDGGWRDIDQHLAAYLAARGVNVIGWSSAEYLWKPKTPQQGGVDLTRIAAVAAGAGMPVFIGGYSMGAEVMPFFLSAWPAAERKTIAGQLLIAPSATASFEWSLTALDWMPFHQDKTTAFRVADAVRQDAVPALCLTGTQVAAANTACSAIADIATVETLPGDHHFNGNYDGIGRLAMAFVEQHAR